MIVNDENAMQSEQVPDDEDEIQDPVQINNTPSYEIEEEDDPDDFINSLFAGNIGTNVFDETLPRAQNGNSMRQPANIPILEPSEMVNNGYDNVESRQATPSIGDISPIIQTASPPSVFHLQSPVMNTDITMNDTFSSMDRNQSPFFRETSFGSEASYATDIDQHCRPQSLRSASLLSVNDGLNPSSSGTFNNVQVNERVRQHSPSMNGSGSTVRMNEVTGRQKRNITFCEGSTAGPEVEVI